MDNDALYCVNCKEDSLIPGLKLGLAWAEKSQQVVLCADCNEDMEYEVCFNSKDICVDCCVKAGDLCGHHLCSEKCPCGRFVKEKQTKGVLSEFEKPEQRLLMQCAACSQGRCVEHGVVYALTARDLAMTPCDRCELWSTSEICEPCFDADWDLAHRWNEWTLPEDENLLVRVLRVLPDAKQSTLMDVLAVLYQSS